MLQLWQTDGPFTDSSSMSWATAPITGSTADRQASQASCCWNQRASRDGFTALIRSLSCSSAGTWLPCVDMPDTPTPVNQRPTQHPDQQHALETPAGNTAARQVHLHLQIDLASCMASCDGEWSSRGWTTASASSQDAGPTRLPCGLQHLPVDSLVKQQEIGRGFYSRVWQASWQGSSVAVKELVVEAASRGGWTLSDDCSHSSASLQAAIFDEALKLHELRHPHVVALVGIVSEPSCCALVMEHMASGSLRTALQRLHSQGKGQGRDGLRLRLACALGVARGMQHLHGRGFVHFDLKPDNILCDVTDLDRPVVKIADLGLSERRGGCCLAGSLRGTMWFMAPELFCGGAGGEPCARSQVTEKVDVYSFGVCLLEIWGMCSEPIYPGMQSGDILAGLLTASLRPEVPSNMDPRWARLMQQCWSSQASSRPSFSDLVSELGAMLSGLSAGLAMSIS